MVGALDGEGLEEDVQNLFRHRDDGTVVVHKWIMDVQYGAMREMFIIIKKKKKKKQKSDEPSRSLVSVSIASRSQWKSSCGGGFHQPWRETTDQQHEWLVVRNV